MENQSICRTDNLNLPNIPASSTHLKPLIILTLPTTLPFASGETAKTLDAVWPQFMLPSTMPASISEPDTLPPGRHKILFNL
mmetsp:Transcript_16113/g.21090  ORF Transcript_16113/g.21090 Transcript_16113/m.21090 type:complete len:82 (+) Transcript_16113:2134-2379(+)